MSFSTLQPPAAHQHGPDSIPAGDFSLGLTRHNIRKKVKLLFTYDDDNDLPRLSHLLLLVDLLSTTTPCSDL